jgi:sulfatase modifying factor 1
VGGATRATDTRAGHRPGLSCWCSCSCGSLGICTPRAARRTLDRSNCRGALAIALGVITFIGCNPRDGRHVAPTHDAPPSPPFPCPEEMAAVSVEQRQVCVDEYEAAIDGHDYARSLDGTDAGTLRAKPARGFKPQVNISEVQAERACEAASKRLCTESEWRAACQGPAHLIYPYGNQYVAGACNTGRSSPVEAVLGTVGGRLDDPRLAEAAGGSEPGGAFPKCISAYGVFDLHGNVAEWVSDSSRADDPRFGTFLGGFFAEASENGEGCLYKTTAHFKEYHDYSIGFRCCKEPVR